ncbi:hypothetical protein Tco_1422871, partial [Tanacetum coccineum]
DDHKNRGVKGYSNSYAHVVKGSKSLNMEMENKPALVPDNSCLNQHDCSNFLVGKVKDFALLSNLKVVLGNEGFDNIELKYTGGYWIMIEFHSEEAKQMFQSNVGIGIWFSQLQQASTDFIIDGRVTWVKIEGQEEECFHRKRICINTNVNSNIFKSFKVIYQGKVLWVRAKEIPGWVPDFVEDNEEETDTDDEINREESNGEDVELKKFSNWEEDSEVEVVPNSKFEEELPKTNVEEVFVGQNDANSEDPYNLYDLVNKKKDDNNKRASVEDSLKFPLGFHSIQDEETVFGVKKYCSKKKEKDDVAESMNLKGASVGNSGGILCVWEPKSFKKLNAPQELIEKKDVVGLFIPCDGELGWRGVDAFNMFISNASLEEVPLADLAELDLVIDKGEGDDDVVNKRKNVVRSLQDLEKLQSSGEAQKAKIK